MRIVIIAMIMGFSLSCTATQTFWVSDGSEVKAVIDKAGLSRIYLTHDRIASIKGLSEEWTMDKNEEIGDVYIKPMDHRTSDTIDIFIQSEKGNTYAVKLIASSNQSQSIKLTAIDLEDDNAGAPENEQAQIIDLIKTVNGGSDIKGYTLKTFPEPGKLKRAKQAVVIREKEYEGEHYRVEVLRVENHTDQTLILADKDFAIHDTLAVSLSHNRIEPKSEGVAYRVLRL